MIGEQLITHMVNQNMSVCAFLGWSMPHKIVLIERGMPPTMFSIQKRSICLLPAFLWPKKGDSWSVYDWFMFHSQRVGYDCRWLNGYCTWMYYIMCGLCRVGSNQNIVFDLSNIRSSKVLQNIKATDLPRVKQLTCWGSWDHDPSVEMIKPTADHRSTGHSTATPHAEFNHWWEWPFIWKHKCKHTGKLVNT